MVARLRALTSYQNSTVGLVKGRNMLPSEAKNSKFFTYSGSALSSQASSQALLFETNRLRIPTGRRQTSWLYTSTAEELSQGLPRTNPASGQSGTSTRDLQISSPAP